MKRSERDIKLKSVHNLRTLAGLKNLYDYEIPKDKFLRAASLNQLTAEDARVLRDQYQLRTIVDLRTEAEMSKEPDVEIEGVEYLYLPVCRDKIPGVSREVDPGNQEATVDMLPDMRDMYRNIISDPACQESFHKILETIIHHRDGAILWHCTAGKDRCGLTTMFLLSMLGVEEEEIIQDYLLTNRDSLKQARKYYLLIRIFKRDKELAKKVYDAYAAKRSYIEAALDEIEVKFGGMDAYIRQQLKITDEEIAVLRQDLFL